MNASAIDIVRHAARTMYEILSDGTWEKASAATQDAWLAAAAVTITELQSAGRIHLENTCAPYEFT